MEELTAGRIKACALEVERADRLLHSSVKRADGHPFKTLVCVKQVESRIGLLSKI
jgi:hypothetical protein